MGTEFVECILNGIKLAERIGVGNIHNMQQQIGFGDLLQCGMECFDERCGEFLNESHSIGH